MSEDFPNEMFDMTADMSEIQTPADLADLLACSAVHHQRMLAKDPEWSTPRSVHRHTLVESFVLGAVRADPWHIGYTLPPRFESVVNAVARHISEITPEAGEVIQLSLLAWEGYLRAWLDGEADFLVMCNQHDELGGPERVTFVSRYSETPTTRDFIDMDALYRNAAVALRDDFRRNDAFDRKFRAEHEAEHPEWFTDDDDGSSSPPGATP